MRWFQSVKLRQVPMFALEPFEWPAVPVRGTYAVAYMNRRCKPLGGPRSSIAIDHPDAWLNHSGDNRTYKPRPRGEVTVHGRCRRDIHAIVSIGAAGAYSLLRSTVVSQF